MGNSQGQPALPETSTRRKEKAAAALRMSIALDNDVKEGWTEEEKVITVAHNYCHQAVQHPEFLARSLPWDYLAPAGDVNLEGLQLLTRLLALPVVEDSAHDDTCSAAPEHLQFIERFLPGVVQGDSWDSMPITAKTWQVDHGDWGGSNAPIVELSRVDTTDRTRRPTDDFTEGIDGSTAEGYLRSKMEPLTTKAGSRLWQISFVAPEGEGEGEGVSATIRAAYQMQLLVRFDRGRQELVYDAFDHKPRLQVPRLLLSNLVNSIR